MGRPGRFGAAVTVVAILITVLVAVPSSPASADPPPCPTFTPGAVRGTVSEPALEELSGLAAGRANAGVLWAHADSGAAAQVHAIDPTGERLASYALEGATAVDWEDLAVGPGPEPDQPYLYVGDIGDNNAVRADVTVYRLPEPVLEVDPGPDPIVVTDVEALTVEYPDGPHDAETVLADPRTGDLFIVTKTNVSGPSGVYRFPAPQVTGATLELVATLSVPSSPFPGSTVTAGDISPDGAGILLRTYFTAFLWRRQPDQSVATALEGVACPMPLRSETQGEAIAYRQDGRAYFTASEWGTAGPRPLHEHTLVDARPDARIRRGTGVLVGNNIYNTTGNRQTRTGSAARGRSVTYHVSVQNDGAATERLRLRGMGSTRRFRVRYYNPAGQNITRQVTGGTARTRLLAPGRTYGVRAVVTVTRAAPRHSSLVRSLTARSTTHPTIRDTVDFVTRRARVG